MHRQFHAAPSPGGGVESRRCRDQAATQNPRIQGQAAPSPSGVAMQRSRLRRHQGDQAAEPSHGAAETIRQWCRAQATQSPRRRRVPAVLTQAARRHRVKLALPAWAPSPGGGAQAAQSIRRRGVKALQRPGGCADCPPAIWRDSIGHHDSVRAKQPTAAS